MKKQVKEQVENKEKVVEQKEENNYVPVESEPIKYDDKCLEDVETERLKFFHSYRVQNTIKLVVFMLCIAAIIVACVVIPNVIPKEQDNLKTGLMLGIVIAAVAATFGYSTFTRRSMNSKMRKYLNTYYKKVNEYSMNQKGFENPVLQEPGKIDLDFFKDCNLYKDVVDVGSRGLTEFEYNGIPMRIVECAGNIKDQKRMRPVFVGKMLHCACSYLGEQNIVIYFKGDNRALPPTNVTELKIVEDNKKYIIYSNNSSYKKVIKANIIKMLDDIEMNKYLVDLAISMHDGKIFVMFGYDDPLMIPPLQNQFDPRPNMQYKKDLGKVIKLVEALNK